MARCALDGAKALLSRFSAVSEGRGWLPCVAPRSNMAQPFGRGSSSIPHFHEEPCAHNNSGAQDGGKTDFQPTNLPPQATVHTFLPESHFDSRGYFPNSPIGNGQIQVAHLNVPTSLEPSKGESMLICQMGQHHKKAKRPGRRGNVCCARCRSHKNQGKVQSRTKWRLTLESLHC